MKYNESIFSGICGKGIESRNPFHTEITRPEVSPSGTGSSINDVTQFWIIFYPLPSAFHYEGLSTAVTKYLTLPPTTVKSLIEIYHK